MKNNNLSHDILNVTVTNIFTKQRIKHYGDTMRDSCNLLNTHAKESDITFA